MESKEAKDKDTKNWTMSVKFTFLKKIFAKENRWGIYIGLIVAMVVYVFNNYFPPSLPPFLSYILQTVAIIIIPTALSSIINHCQRETIESATEVALGKIKDKYKEISCNSINLFKIFQLNGTENCCCVAHKIFFNNLIESYSNNGEKRKYHIPIDTYYKVIQDFLNTGYKMKTINGMLLPFWYVPKEKDEALADYTSFCKDNAELYERVTYYQDYEDDNWKNDTVKMIYLDLLSSEKSDDVAVRWLITLIAKVSELKNVFGGNIEEILHIRLDKNIPYLQLHNTEIDNTIKSNITKISEFLDQKYDDTTVSRKMTDIINDKFFKDMNGKNRFVKKSEIDASFKDVINFEDVTEVGYYYKDDKKDDQFVIFLNGSNTGPSVEIEIITENEKIVDIQPILSELFKGNKE